MLSSMQYLYSAVGCCNRINTPLVVAASSVVVDDLLRSTSMYYSYYELFAKSQEVMDMKISKETEHLSYWDSLCE